MKSVLITQFLISGTTAYSFFEPVTCFQKASIPVAGYDQFYCCGNLLLWVASITNATLFGCLLFWHLKEKGFREARTYLKIKTWMLVLLTLFTLISCLRYTFSLSTSAPSVYAGLLVLQQQCEAISYLLICWYFFSKTDKLLDNSSVMGIIIKVICVLSVFSFVSIFVYQVQEVSDGHIATLCKTMFFIVPETFGELTVIAFVCLGIKLTRVFNDLKLH